MTIDFTDSDDLVETVHNDYEEDPSFLEANLVDDLSEAGTENSVSDYEGKVQEAPLKMLFGLKECRAIFVQATDQGAFVRVCGNKEGTCKRGHPALNRPEKVIMILLLLESMWMESCTLSNPSRSTESNSSS